MHQQPYLKYRPLPPLAAPNRGWPDVVIDHALCWCSGDSRDGNQALIEPIGMDRKLCIFQMPVRVGCKEIEVGFPAVSQTDFDFVRLLIKRDLIPEDVTIQVLTHAREALIQSTFEPLAGAQKVVLDIYNAVSPAVRAVVLGINEDDVVDLAPFACSITPTTRWAAVQTRRLWRAERIGRAGHAAWRGYRHRHRTGPSKGHRFGPATLELPRRTAAAGSNSGVTRHLVSTPQGANP